MCKNPICSWLQKTTQTTNRTCAAKFLACFFEISKKLNGCHISPIEKQGAYLMCCICVSCSCSDLILACEPVTPNGCLFVLFCLIFCELDSHIKSISCSRFFNSGNISKLEKIAAFVSLRLDDCNAWNKSLSHIHPQSYGSHIFSNIPHLILHPVASRVLPRKSSTCC